MIKQSIIILTASVICSVVSLYMLGAVIALGVLVVKSIVAIGAFLHVSPVAIGLLLVGFFSVFWIHYLYGLAEYEEVFRDAM